MTKHWLVLASVLVIWSAFVEGQLERWTKAAGAYVAFSAAPESEAVFDLGLAGGNPGGQFALSVGDQSVLGGVNLEFRLVGGVWAEPFMSLEQAVVGFPLGEARVWIGRWFFEPGPMFISLLRYPLSGPLGTWGVSAHYYFRPDWLLNAAWLRSGRVWIGGEWFPYGLDLGLYATQSGGRAFAKIQNGSVDTYVRLDLINGTWALAGGTVWQRAPLFLRLEWHQGLWAEVRYRLTQAYLLGGDGHWTEAAVAGQVYLDYQSLSPGSSLRLGFSAASRPALAWRVFLNVYTN